MTPSIPYGILSCIIFEECQQILKTVKENCKQYMHFDDEKYDDTRPKVITAYQIINMI